MEKSTVIPKKNRAAAWLYANSSVSLYHFGTAKRMVPYPLTASQVGFKPADWRA